jgi:peptidoglycan/xylan/chitin deacetylase (PgdA/CDA1 family)
MLLFRPGLIAGLLYPDALFRVRTEEKLLYLTFDDGPDPGSTPRLLNILDNHNVRAVFFCDGKAAEKFPDLMALIRSRGHIIGNHGYNHLSGWITPFKKYISDISHASKYTSSTLFRPPYGRLRSDQYRELKKTYKIVLWDIMPYDFDKKFGSGNSLRILKKKLRPGSIIVFHDSVHSTANKILEAFITFSVDSGYRFEVIGDKF